mgnify:CR=1 FL=1
MRKKEKIAAMLLLVSLLAAAQHPDTVRNITLEDVVVTATRTAVSRDVVPLTVSTISRREIEESSESNILPVLSERVPGLFVTERGVSGFGVATGAAGQISLRGVGGSPTTQVLILLNGNPQFMGIMGHPLADAYVASDVEKVEVIRGPASVLYGTNAMGGVINIITREQTAEGYSGNARVMYGSYNTQKYAVNGGYKKKGFEIFAGINRDHTDGHRDSSAFSINNAYAKAGYAINSHLKINANFSLAGFTAQDPGPEGGYAGNSIDITRGMGSVSFDNQWDKIKGSVRYFYNFGEHVISDGFHSKDKNYGISAYESFSLFKGNTLMAGLDYMNYGGMAENTRARNGLGMLFVDTAVNELGVYGLVQQQFFEKLTVNGAFRYQYNSMFGREPVPSGGFAFKASPTTTLKGSVSKGFRSPSLRELFMFSPANPDLKPERMINYEGGIYQSFFRHKATVELTVFRAEGSNIIQTLSVNGIPKYYNTGAFSNTGVEASLKIRAIDNLILHGNYTYIHMETPLIATPRQQIFSSITYLWKKFTFNVSMQNIIDLYLQTGNTPVTASFNVLNARVGYKINSRADIFCKGENLLNETYQTLYRYPMPGIVLFGGINLHL